MIFELDGKKPKIGKNVFIAQTAVVIGDVEIKDGASIWYGAVLRGDMASIVVGEKSNIQDNCSVHTDYGNPALIGDSVTVGHNSVIHGCLIEKQSLIGIGSVILTGAQIKTGTVVAAGSLVKENQIVGPNQLVAGSPAAVKRELTPETLSLLEKPIENYLHLSKYHASLKPAE
ncbi:MAG: gamma carbonic anhydrase family protein [Thermodesulfobacteriota bacterium]